MITGNDEPLNLPQEAPEEIAPIDGAESVWDPWLVSMYIDAVRSVGRRERPSLFH